jgi:hypothetical protein
MIKRKGIVPNITMILGILIYEFVAINLYQWTGIKRSLIAGIVGGICYFLGTRIEETLLEKEVYEKKGSSNKLLTFIPIIVVIGLVLGINFLVKSQVPKQIEFKDIDGNFSVYFPELPTKGKSTKQWFYGKLYWTVYTSTPKKENMNLYYRVSYCDMPKTSLHSDSLQYIQEISNTTQAEIYNIVGDQGLDKLSVKQLNKYPGREYIWKDIRNGIGYTCRCYIVKYRIYVLEVKYKLEMSYNNDIEGFLDQFKLLEITDNLHPEILPERPVKIFDIVYPKPPVVRENPAYLQTAGLVYSVSEIYEVPTSEREDPNCENLAYGVNYTKLPNDKINSDSTELVKQLLITSAQRLGNIIEQNEIDYKGYWGLEVLIESQNLNMVYHTKSFIIKDMYYQILVLSVKGKEDNKSANDFIHSFRLK